MGQHGVEEAMHYLHDFLVFGSPGSQECEKALDISLQLCKQLGVLVAPRKLEGPGTALPFLEILIDTQKELRLPGEKLSCLKGLISTWKGRKSCQKQHLLCLIGQLQHACRVVQAGWTFLRRIIHSGSRATPPHSSQQRIPVRLTMVGSFLGNLEWCFYVWQLRSRLNGDGVDIRRIRIIGVRCI